MKPLQGAAGTLVTLPTGVPTPCALSPLLAQVPCMTSRNLISPIRPLIQPAFPMKDLNKTDDIGISLLSTPLSKQIT